MDLIVFTLSGDMMFKHDLSCFLNTNTTMSRCHSQIPNPMEVHGSLALSLFSLTLFLLNPDKACICKQSWPLN